MMRLVTGYFVWDLAVWLAIFCFTAALLFLFVHHRKKAFGVVLSRGEEEAERPLSAFAEGSAWHFLRESLIWWLAREQAQLMLFAVIVLFFAAALFRADPGGAGL